MKILKKIARVLGTLEKGLLVGMVFVMILLSFLQVVLREFFSTSILWGDTFLRHLVLWVAFFGAAIATDQNGHFAIDVVKNSLPPVARRLAQLVTDLFVSVVMAFMVRAAVTFFIDEYKFGSILFTVGETQVPAFWMDSILPIGFGLLLAHFLIKTVEGLLALFRPEDEGREGSV